eukprot:3809509-Rhodomonas_salina.4
MPASSSSNRRLAPRYCTRPPPSPISHAESAPTPSSPPISLEILAPDCLCCCHSCARRRLTPPPANRRARVSAAHVRVVLAGCCQPRTRIRPSSSSSTATSTATRRPGGGAPSHLVRGVRGAPSEHALPRAASSGELAEKVRPRTLCSAGSTGGISSAGGSARPGLPPSFAHSSSSFAEGSAVAGVSASCWEGCCSAAGGEGKAGGASGAMAV